MSVLPKVIQPYLNKPVAIFGKGVSGKASALLLDFNKIPYVIYDEGERIFDAGAISHHELIIASPGFSQEHAWLELAREHGKLYLSEIDFACLFWKGKIIGITGTNGKTTTTELLALALKRMGFHAEACGNIGLPLSRLCCEWHREESYAVCEISSFQSEVIHFLKLDALLWTHFDEDHLDRHKTYLKYFKSKYNLLGCVDLKSDIFLGDTVLEAIKKFNYKVNTSINFINYKKNIRIDNQKESVFRCHPNSNNYEIVEALWKKRNYPLEILEETANQFKLSEHRLDKFHELCGVSFWDDSKATNFSAAVAGLEHIGGYRVWIGGGKYKGGDLEGFVEKVKNEIEVGFLIGEVSEALEFIFFKKDFKSVVKCDSLEGAVRGAWKYIESERRRGTKAYEVVLSPGFSSFDMFRSYSERGKYFKKYVLELKS